MPIMRGPSGATTAFMIPCFGEGIFVVVNTKLNCGGVAYWDGTSMQKLTIGDGYIQNITVQDGIATVIDEETFTATFTADKTPREIFETKLPTWCVVTFAPGTFVDHEFIVCAPRAFNGTYIAFGYIYDIQNGKNKWFVCQDGQLRWKLDLTVFAK
jgi:hypothetical protein